MKTSKRKIEEDFDSKSSVQTLDPFAVDFFGVKDTPLEIEEAEQKPTQNDLITQKLNLGEIEGLDWYKYLSVTTMKESLFSNQLLAFPGQLNSAVFDCLAKTISKYTSLEKRQIKFTVNEVKETNLSDAITELNNEPNVFLTIKSNSDEYFAHIAIDRLLTSKFIDHILGGTGKKNESLRELSAIERTIIEFLTINLLSDLKNDLSISTINLVDVTNKLDKKNQDNKRGALVDLSLSLGKIKGKISFLTPIELLETLENARKSVFLKNTAVERAKKIKKIAKAFSTNVLIGETQVSVNDIPFLEKDDVILVNEPSQILNNEIKVYIGDGTNYSLTGMLQTTKESDILQDEIIFKVENINSDKVIWTQQERERMNMNNETEKEELPLDESENSVSDEAAMDDSSEQESYETHIERTPVEEEIDEESLASLENVMINLRVNLGGRRLSLSELQNIRVGQIIELGCRPTDPVQIVTESDNKPIAIGELLEIEGHLGVRLKKILV